MRWPWKRRPKHNGHEAARAKAEAEGALRATKSFTQHVARMAPDVAALPADEFADRVARAFRGGRA